VSPLSPSQRLVVRTRDRDMLVSAGAGSGKTLVLIERLLGCIEDDGIPLDRILVVTFTEKAASELRNKIYRKLAERQDLAPMRHRLPQARISTIHSFCARLLRERFDSTGLDPRFRVLPEEEATLLLSGAMDRIFRDAYRGRWGDERRQRFERLVEICGHEREGERLRRVVRRLLDYARASENPVDFLQRHLARNREEIAGWDKIAWIGSYAERIERQWLAGLGLVEAVLAELEAAGAEAAAWEEAVRRLRAVDPADLSTPGGQQRILVRLGEAGLLDDSASPRIKLPVLSRKKPKVEGLSYFKGVVQKLYKKDWLALLPLSIDRVLSDEKQSSRLTGELARLALEVWNVYEEMKRRRGALDFSDLEIRALKLLAETPSIGEQVRFDRVFIDEFQDVNALQHRILERLCDPAGIFRVGDIKQSIYQFRLADPTIFRRLMRAESGRVLVAEPEKPPLDQPKWTVPLPDNYRSRPPILAFVNRVAGRLFLPAEIGTDYEAQELRAGRSDPGEPPRVELMLVREGEGKGKGESKGEDESEERFDPEEAEGRAIAARIRSLVENGATCLDPDSGRERPLSYSDVAILLRSHAPGARLQRILEEEGIPVYVSSGASFFRAREIEDLVQLLSVVDNLLDDIALAAALRSPAFCWKDAEILALRLAYPEAIHLAYPLALIADEAPGGGLYAGRVLPEDPAEAATLAGARADLPGEPEMDDLPARSAAVMARLCDWRERAGELELPELIVRILEETDLLRSVASLPGGLRRQSNLRKFIGLARRYARDSGHSLHPFLRWLRELREGGSRIAEAPISSESTPAVRVLSIHQAKGLEFPVVFVARLDRPLLLGETVDALAPGEEFLGIQLLDADRYVRRRPIPLRLLRAESESKGIEEEKRILYVALTRARDRLILSGIKTSRASPAPIAWRAYQRSLEKGGGTGSATLERLLSWKRSYLAWLLYALPPIDEPAESAPPGGVSERLLADLPLIVRWISPGARPNERPAMTPIRALEPKLRSLEPVSVEEPDAETEKLLRRIVKTPPLPSPGHLAHAKGKIWATEFKSGRALADRADFGGILHPSALEDAPDEPAAPLFPADDDARAEGRLIHLLLERLDFRGLDRANAGARVAAAAEAMGGAPPAVVEMLGASLAAFVALPIGGALAASTAIEREVSFGMRMGILEAANLLPSLGAEILTSPDWTGWIAEGEDKILRLADGMDSRAVDPWILVQGRIDLLFRDARGWIILDWKSDRVASDAEIDARVATYRGQMEIYRRAVRELFQEPVRSVLYFLRPAILKEV